MTTPAFFDQLPVIRVRDPLAGFLGASDDGILDYRYLDAVRLAGHSCPTVAAAWNMTRLGLAALYDGEMPERGAIRVELAESADAGVSGVIASIVGLITGAAGAGGFKGIAGRFRRQGLLAFAADIPRELRLTRLDNGSQVDLGCELRHVSGDPAMPALMQRCLAGAATALEQQRFAALWQARVCRLLCEHGDDPRVFIVRPVGAADQSA